MHNDFSAHSSGLSVVVDFFDTIIRRKTIIIRLSFVVFISSIIVSLTLPKTYTATTRFIPPQQDQNAIGLMLGQLGGGMASFASDILGGSSTADLYVGILKTEAVKDVIIDKFSLMKVYDEKYRVDTYRDLDDKVEIVSGKKDGIISITVEDKDPKRAADIANAYVIELGKLTSNLSINGAKQNKKFLENRLDKVKSDLTKAENSLKIFQENNKTVDVGEQAKATIASIAELQAKLASAETQLEIYRTQFTDANQEVINVKSTIKDIKTQISRLEKKTNIGAIPSVGSMPSLAQQYVRLMRDYKMQETLLELLLKQYEMAKLTEANDVAAIQVIQAARIPDKKTKPKRAAIVLITTFLGMGISVVIAFVVENYARSSDEDKLKWRAMIKHLRG